MAPTNDRPESEDTRAEESPNTEKGSEEEDQKPPKPVHFFHSKLRHVRREVYSKWALTTVVLMAFIMAVLSLYWAALFRVEQNLSSMNIAVVNFDGLTAPYNTSGITPIIGPSMISMARQLISSATPHLGYIPMTASDFGYDPINVRQAVYDQHYYGAIIINANATSSLQNAISTGDTTFSPLGIAQLIYVEARDQTAWDTFIYPYIAEFQTEATSMIGSQWAKTVLQQAVTNATIRENIALVPQAVSPAIGFSQFNLRPFYPYQITPTVTVGLIYLIILSFFSFSFYLPVYMKLIKPEGHPPLHLWQMIVVRYIGIQGAYLFLSLAYTLVSLSFKINFSTPNAVQSDTMVTLISGGNPAKYGAATFPVLWCLNWIGMMALGLACENVAMIVGQPWTGLFLIIWVISNVSTSFYPIEIESHFYYWGYAWPLHNIVEGTRTILFDLHSRLGLNFGILIAWTAVNSILFPFCCKFMSWKSKKQVHEYWA